MLESKGRDGGGKNLLALEIESTDSSMPGTALGMCARQECAIPMCILGAENVPLQILHMWPAPVPCHMQVTFKTCDCGWYSHNGGETG